MIDECSERWLCSQLGQPLRSRRPVAGGCIHHAWRLELADGRALFVKINRVEALPLFEAEASGLRALAAVAPPQLLVPIPLALGRTADRALLVLPWLDLMSTAEQSAWRRLGVSLAALHRASLSTGPGRGEFGWDHDNAIGSTSQPNDRCHDWGRFFARCRLGHQLRLAAGRGQGYRGAERLLAAVEQRLAGHCCEPVLVHGDLWSGNAGLLRDGGVTLFDPAVHRADREVDLAMARLFGGFPAAFFSGYEATWPLPVDAGDRVELYNLYHLLNHALQFGGGYQQQAQASIELLLAG